MLKRLNRRRINIEALFENHFVNVKALYAYEFGLIPSIAFIGELDAAKALAFLKAHFEARTRCVGQHAYFDHAEKEMLFNNIVFVLSNDMLIEVGHNYVQILHRIDQLKQVQALIESLAKFKISERQAIGFATNNVN